MSAIVTLSIAGPRKRCLESAALLNGGFSSRSPSLLLPRAAALELFPEYPAGTRPLGAATAGGRISLRVAPVPAWVRVVTKDREGTRVRFQVVVSEAEDEVLVSDYGIDALGVKIERQGEGLWRFADEERVRPSVARRSWPTSAGE